MKISKLILGSAILFVAGSLSAEHPVEFDSHRKPRLSTGGNCVIRQVTIHDAVKPAFVGDVLVQGGKIAAVGTIEAPAGLLQIDGSGLHLAPGVVDCHSHIAIDGGVNEGTVSISAEVSIEDVVDPKDVAIYRALAGGVTTARLLHGSANTIGGQDEVIKLKWGRTADELRFRGGPRGVKFALGENPKRSNGGGWGNRFPSSRMGVEAVFERAFQRAREYSAEWDAYAAARARGEDPASPRRDVRLQALSDILRKEILVHSHCYRADEILMLIRVAQRYGFAIGTLQHVLEAYKVAPEMAEAGVASSTFSDWWAFKVEAYDGIPQNAALMDEAGVSSSINSDSEEMMRRMYHEAAKSVRYAGMDAVRALRLVTQHPAEQLGIGDSVGTIEVGKDADLVLTNAEPLSSYARVIWTMVDGEIEFERRDAFELDSRPATVRQLELAAPSALLAMAEGAPMLAITNARIFPIRQPVIERGTILIQGEKIVGVGAELRPPAGARIIDAGGRHVYPGLIALGTNIGMKEIGSVPATDDDSERGGNQPDMHTAASIHGDSAHIPVTRSNGVTRAQVSPRGGGPLLGQSAVIQLSGDNWEEFVRVDRDMLHVRFPVSPNESKNKDRKPSEGARELRKLFAEAREYGRLMDLVATDPSARPEYDPRLEAMVPYARAQRRVALHADNAQTILEALRFARDEQLDAVLYGAAEGWKVADVIAQEGRPVVVGPVLALPSQREDPYDAAYANAAVLARAGVSIAIMPADDENPRNLAFHAAMAACFGLPREEALRAITLYPASILKLDSEVGSLAPGMTADLIITSGDVLEIASRVDYVFVAGVQQDLSNRQTELYERYRQRMLDGKAAKAK